MPNLTLLDALLGIKLKAAADLRAEVSTVQNSPFRFLDLPFELRRQIIRYAISIHRRERTPHDWIMLGQTVFETEGYDFIISAAGLKFLNLTSFGLCLVNNQLRQEALSIIFQNATVCLHIQPPRYGPFSEQSASVLAIIQTLSKYPLLRDMAREVTVFINPELPYIHTIGPKVDMIVDRFTKNRFTENPFWIMLVPLVLGYVLRPVLLPVLRPFASLAGWVYRTAPFWGKRNADLQTLVDAVAHEFKTFKHLKIILYLENLHLQDAKIILGLMSMPNCTITLEEWWDVQWWNVLVHRRRRPIRQLGLEIYDARYKNFVPAAAKESGHKWLLFVCPSLEEIEVDETENIMKRRRVWFG